MRTFQHEVNSLEIFGPVSSPRMNDHLRSFKQNNVVSLLDTSVKVWIFVHVSFTLKNAFTDMHSAPSIVFILSSFWMEPCTLPSLLARANPCLIKQRLNRQNQPSLKSEHRDQIIERTILPLRERDNGERERLSENYQISNRAHANVSTHFSIRNGAPYWRGSNPPRQLRFETQLSDGPMADGPRENSWTVRWSGYERTLAPR